MLKKKLYICLIITALTVLNSYAQNVGEVKIKDTIAPSSDEFNMLSPAKAAFYSAVLPGLGQAYNKKYWKIPLVYAGFGTIGYFIGWNNKNYNTYKSAYRDLSDTIPETDSYLEIEASQYYNLDDPTEYANFKSGLYKQQEYFRRNRDLLIISIIGFYGLNIIDASVDAHLFDFDISEDLSMNWQPTVQPYRKELIYGLNFTFNF